MKWENVVSEGKSLKSRDALLRHERDVTGGCSRCVRAFRILFDSPCLRISAASTLTLNTAFYDPCEFHELYNSF